MEITITKTTTPKPKPDENNLRFGKTFTDHMFIMDYSPEQGWHDARIVPYAPLMMDPAAMILHYGQGIFEGLKAYKTAGGEILLFRPEKNMERVNKSNERLCIPQIDVDFCVKALKTFVNVERDWVPSAPGTSLEPAPVYHCNGRRPGRAPLRNLPLYDHRFPQRQLLCRGHQPR